MEGLVEPHADSVKCWRVHGVENLHASRSPVGSLYVCMLGLRKTVVS